MTNTADSLTADTESCTIPVTGMTCAACSGRVQRTLEQTAGVATANVNLMTGAATVRYDPEVTSPARLVDTIRSTGYGAELPVAEESGEELLDVQDAARAGEIGSSSGSLVSAVAGVLMMVFGMAGDRGATDAMRYLQLAVTCRWSAGRAVISIPGPGPRSATTARHEHADRGRHGAAFLFSAGVTLFDDWFADNGVEPHVYYEAVVWIIGLVLLGNLLRRAPRAQTSGAIGA